MALQAVITGDIVNSSAMSKQQRTYIISQLKICFAGLRKKKFFSFQKPFEVFRGDSFQGIINQPEQALRIAIIIRALIIKLNKPQKKSKSKTTKVSVVTLKDADVRIAIGIGEVNIKARKVVESDGEAFHNSGKLLDAIKNSGERIMIKSSDKILNDELSAGFTLLDFIMSKWTPQQCEAIYEMLNNNYSQQQLSRKLKISQPSVHQRLKISGWYSVEKFLNYYEAHLNQNKV
ncbi:MAG: SatD family protein [Bacteroidia bacterium]